MYRRVDWMKAADQSILQLLGPPKKLSMTTSNIAKNTGLSRQHVSRRANILVENGLLEVEEEDGSHPFYSISDKGRALLKGEIEPESLNDADES